MKIILMKNNWLDGVEHGWGNGYVVIPEGHPSYGKHYDEIDVDIHGGLTYGGLVTYFQLSKMDDLDESDVGGWLVGFDTAHSGDDEINWPESRVKEEAEYLERQLREIK